MWWRRARRSSVGGDTAAESYLFPFRGRHRSDWGEEFLEQLDRWLVALRPATVDRHASRVFVGRGGVLHLSLVRTDGPPVEGTFYEDEAEITCGDSHREWAVDPPEYESWIPAALAHVEGLIQP